MTQFSFKWILSLNCLCQNWGQVQRSTELPALDDARRIGELERKIGQVN
jgi:hypothetical protein